MTHNTDFLEVRETKKSRKHIFTLPVMNLYQYKFKVITGKHKYKKIGVKGNKNKKYLIPMMFESQKCLNPKDVQMLRDMDVQKDIKAKRIEALKNSSMMFLALSPTQYIFFTNFWKTFDLTNNDSILMERFGNGFGTRYKFLKAELIAQKEKNDELKAELMTELKPKK